MKPARIVLILVALVAGGLAAFLATRGDGPAPVETQTISEVVEEPRTRILVASAPIGMGERLSAELLEWQDWPTGALRDDYVTEELVPDATQALSGAVARFEFFPGEPIRQIKLVRSDQGYLSAVIPQGMRAVSIGVTAESGAGGFIVPNDRVDVVLSRGTTAGTISETILANVKVLAIGQRLGQVGASGDPEGTGPSAQTFQNSTIATLVMTPAQAESIINASSTGALTLVLRSVADFNEDSDSSLQNASQSIRLIRFGNEVSVMSGVTGAVTTTGDLGGVPTTPTDADPDGLSAAADFTPPVVTTPPAVTSPPVTDTSAPPSSDLAPPPPFSPLQ